MICPEEFYIETTGFKISSNYQTIEGSVSYGRTIRKGEKREKLVEDVSSFVEKNVGFKIAEAEKLLLDNIKKHK